MKHRRSCCRENGMKPHIAIPLGVAGILAGIGTAIANANGVFAGHTSLHFWFYTASFIMIAIAVAGWRLARDNEWFPLKKRLELGEDASQQSKIFVLEVDGSQPLDGNSDWRLFLTNCSTRILRSVQLYNIKSEIGAYILGFKEVPVMQPGQKVTLGYEVSSRRLEEKYGQRKPTLWDFGIDHAGERGTTFIWYDIYIEYREPDENKTQSGGFVAFCFDLQNKKLKTEGAEESRKDRRRKHIFPFD
jgi:hypothetical protein